MLINLKSIFGSKTYRNPFLIYFYFLIFSQNLNELKSELKCTDIYCNFIICIY